MSMTRAVTTHTSSANNRSSKPDLILCLNSAGIASHSLKSLEKTRFLNSVAASCLTYQSSSEKRSEVSQGVSCIDG